MDKGSGGRGRGGGSGGAVPTGCYKCGRPGHWSRDCPSNPSPNPNSSSSYSKTNSSTFNSTGGAFGGSKPFNKSSAKPKRAPRSRPKLTPELLLSDDGIGYILRYFPRAFKYRGRGREVSNLGNLIGLYIDWHSHLLPYYPFDQFVHKLEQVGATRRVKTCLGGLRDRVANGGDPTKLHESPVEHSITNNDEDAMNIEEPCLHDTANLQEDMLQEVYKQATKEPTNNPDVSSSIDIEVQISEEQKARMEANRLKALEKAAARARSLKTA